MRIRDRARRQLLLVGVLLGAGCGSRPTDQATPPVPHQDSPAIEARLTVLCLGTSLTAGPGLLAEETWPALIQARVDSLGLPFRLVNAGVSGETSAGALRRIDWLLGQGPVAVLIVETGANDMLRGQSIDSLAVNLDSLLGRAARELPPPRLVIAAMEALPNLGRGYGTRFREMYREAARRYGAVLIPFLLDGVAGIDSLNQSDGIHPTAAGERLVAENVWRALEPVLREEHVKRAAYRGAGAP